MTAVLILILLVLLGIYRALLEGVAYLKRLNVYVDFIESQSDQREN
jgi:hypothetical protein